MIWKLDDILFCGGRFGTCSGMFVCTDDDPSIETDGLVALVCHGITNVKWLERPPIVEMLPSIVSD